MNRRNFIKSSAILTGMGLLPSSLYAMPRHKTLILLELKGGNDGLNTVVPYADSNYYKLRPSIAIPKDQVLQLTPELGLHPSLKPLYSLWQDKEMAVINGVGYEKPNRSHFRSIEIWETASQSEDYSSEGWLSPYLNKQHSGDGLNAVVIGNDMGPLTGVQDTVVIDNVERFLKRAANIKSVNEPELALRNKALAHIQSVQSSIAHSKNKLGQNFKTIATTMASNVNTSVFKLSHGSFDTHANQPWKHKQLLSQLSAGIAAFKQAMQEVGMWDDVVVMTYSEFGRRAAENGSRGTDHGTAAPHFVMGGNVKGGLYGEQVSLSRLENNDLQYTTDFKQVYASVIQGHLGFSPIAQSGSQLYGAKSLPIFRDM